MSGRTTTHPERRVRGLFLGILVVLTIFAAQLVRLQGLDAGGLAAKGERQRLVDEPIPAPRGVITDARGVVLADNLERYTLVADQKAVSEYKKKVAGRLQQVGAKGAAADVAPLLKLPVADLEARLTGSKRYVRVANDVTPLAWRSVSRLGIGGLAVERGVRRTYPQGVAAASVVGVLTNDGRPAGGIEAMLDARLKGTAGKQTYEQTATGRRIPTADTSYVPPVPGQGVRLTIDSDLSWYAQNALAAAVPKVQALSANVVVMDVPTGKLLTVANYPTFDPGDLSTLEQGGYLGNRAFDEVYEPGSTAKVITTGAALQEKIVTPTTPVTVPNRLRRADQTFRDSHDHATLSLTATGVLAQSSNIGTILVGEKMPSATYLDYVSRFGLGHPTGIGFPGESPGLVPKTVADSQRYTVLFGQGLSVNAVQSASVFQTIANGGKRVAPTLVEGTTDGSGFHPSAAPASAQVVSPETAATLTRMMESVVSGEGTATRAQVPGYLVAGKTGTANRYDTAKKGYNGYTASFVGFAPADKPRFVVAVTVQRPLAGESGGAVAAPIFAQVMKYVLQRYAIPPSGAPAGTFPLTTDGSDPVHGGVARRSPTPVATAETMTPGVSPTTTRPSEPTDGATSSTAAPDPAATTR